MHSPVRNVDRKVWRDSGLSEGMRLIPEETAIALTYNGGTYAVMMGTPQNLRDFAIGFSLSEGIVQSPDDIRSLDIVRRLHDAFAEAEANGEIAQVLRRAHHHGVGAAVVG